MFFSAGVRSLSGCFYIFSSAESFSGAKKRREILIEEIPTNAETEYTFVERIMGSKEVCFVETSGVYMAVHGEKARVLKMEVGIYVDERIVSYFHSAVGAVGCGICLYGVLPQCRTVVGCIVLGEVACIGSEIAFQHARNLETQVEIGVNVEVGYGQYVLIGRFLIGNHVFPIEWAEREVL